ncbi:hypothetical protein BGW80DRAFT_877611 [Lactifluus volemus]|nr:hypothetical protein BGW80DRAFT_877611 [Lactifluus volemus]
MGKEGLAYTIYKSSINDDQSIELQAQLKYNFPLMRFLLHSQRIVFHCGQISARARVFLEDGRLQVLYDSRRCPDIDSEVAVPRHMAWWPRRASQPTKATVRKSEATHHHLSITTITMRANRTTVATPSADQMKRHAYTIVSETKAQSWWQKKGGIFVSNLLRGVTVTEASVNHRAR